MCQEQPVAFSSKCFTTSEASFADHGVKKPSCAFVLFCCHRTKFNKAIACGRKCPCQSSPNSDKKMLSFYIFRTVEKLEMAPNGARISSLRIQTLWTFLATWILRFSSIDAWQLLLRKESSFWPLQPIFLNCSLQRSLRYISLICSAAGSYCCCNCWGLIAIAARPAY